MSRFLLVVCGGGCKTNSNEFSAGIVPCDCRLHFLPILRYDELNLCPLDIFALHLSSVHISACYSLRLLSSPTLISPCSRSSTRLSGPLAPRPLILTAESPSLPEVHGVCIYRLPLLKLMSLPRYRLRDSRFFARMGCRVIMVNRKEDQGESAIERIKAECKGEGTAAKIEWVGLDLGSLKMVKEVMGGLAKSLDRLDLVSRPRSYL